MKSLTYNYKVKSKSCSDRVRSSSNDKIQSFSFSQNTISLSSEYGESFSGFCYLDKRRKKDPIVLPGETFYQ